MADTEVISVGAVKALISKADRLKALKSSSA